MAHTEPSNSTQQQLQQQTLGGAQAEEITYLGQAHMKAIDDELMSPDYGFSVDQLMELAGVSIAAAIHKEYPPTGSGSGSDSAAQRVLVVCGPGNNGGDGLVAARHLKHFGYDVTIVYPKRTPKPLYQGLVKQCETLEIPIEAELPDEAGMRRYGIVVDAVFGFSFTGEVRAPFGEVLRRLRQLPETARLVAVDIPSGWDLEKGDATGDGLKPQMLVSLTAPKLGARHFPGVHYVGGRFVPPAFARKHNLVLPRYVGSEQCVRI